MVHRFVELSLGVVDTEFREERVHPEGASFVGDDGDHAFTEGLVFHERAQHANKGHGGGDFHFPFRSFIKFRIRTGIWQVDGFAWYSPFWQVPSEGFSTLCCISDKFWDVAGHHVGVGFKVLVGECQPEVVSHELHGVHIGFLFLMGRVSARK